MLQFKREAANLRIFQVQKKLVIRLALFSAVLVFFFASFNFSIGNTIPGFVFTFFLPLFVLSYYLLKKDINTFWVVNGLIFMNLSILILNFFTNGGYLGPTNYGFFIMTFVLTLLFTGVLKYTWLIVLLLTHTILMYLDIFDLKEVTNGYDDPLSLYVDHIVAFSGCAIFVFLINDLFTRNYVKQNILLEQASQALDEKMQALEVVNSGKNKLLGILAHDLRGPIKSTGQIIELIQNKALEPEEQEMIFQSLGKQYKEIDQTLTTTLEFVLAEIGSDKSPQRLQETNPIEFTERLLRAFSVRIEEKQLKINLTFDGVSEEDLLVLELNEIEVILRNILDNAIKYSPLDSEIFLTLSIADNKIRWEIKDQGPGMDKETSQQLFKFKVQSTIGTNKEKGIGLGMYLCKSLADNIGARLSFESTEGKGTTFILEKPLVQ